MPFTLSHLNTNTPQMEACVYMSTYKDKDKGIYFIFFVPDTGGQDEEGRGWGVGLVVRNACPCKGPGLNSQHSLEAHHYLGHRCACGAQTYMQAKHV